MDPSVKTLLLGSIFLDPLTSKYRQSDLSSKRQITIRLDSDVVAWFKAHAEGNRGYQTSINRALRKHVQRCESEVPSD